MKLRVNKCGLKISVVKIYRTVVSAYNDRSVEKYKEQVVILVFLLETVAHKIVQTIKGKIN